MRARCAAVTDSAPVSHIRPGFDFDEGDRAATPRNNIDFPKPASLFCLHAPRQDAPACEPQGNHAQRLRPSSAFFGVRVGGGHFFAKASARA